MKDVEFAAGYDPSRMLTPRGEQFNTLMAEPRRWSHLVGRLIHRTLGETDADIPMTGQDWRNYYSWLDTDARAICPQLLSIKPEEEAGRALNEFAFHELSHAMFDMWRPILFKDGWGNKPRFRLEAINLARDRVASCGLGYAYQRKRLIQIMGGTETVYESPEAVGSELYKAIVGKLQEFDSAIVLLDVMRRNPDLTVVPAPMQFESSRIKSRNVDFLVVDVKQESVIGIQVKSKLRPEHLENIDHDRVIMIDGDTDLNNVRAVRIKHGSSKQSVVPWPGMISAKSFERTKLYGQGRSIAAARNRAEILSYKIYAKGIVGDTRVDFAGLSTRIGERIMSKLSPDKD